MRRLRTILAGAAGLLLCSAGAAYGAVWHTAVSSAMTVENDSNPLLESGSQSAVTRTIITPDYNLIGTYGRDELRFGLGLNLVRSSDPSIVTDREDPDLQFAWQRESETGGFGFSAGYAESSTLSNAIEDTGVVAADGTQKTYSLDGNWSSALSERSTLTNNSNYSRVSYDIDSLTGYDELSTRLSWNYAWSERIEPFTSFAISHYEPQDTAQTQSSDSYTPSTGLKLQITEQLEATVRAGLNQVSGTSSGPRGQGGLALHYRGERFASSIDVGRSTVASGDGGFTEISTLNGAWSYAVSEVSRVGMDAAWQDSKGKTPNTTQNFTAWASREFSPFWLGRVSLAYKQRQEDDLPMASANIIGVTLTYSHPDF